MSFTLSAENKDLSFHCKSLLQGQRKLVVWGGTGSLAIYEWQRQVKAEFLVDTRWEWWNDRVFFGMPVYSPSEIRTLNPASTLISNNFSYSGVNVQIQKYLARIGGYPTLEPMSLRDMVRLAADLKAKPVFSPAGQKNHIRQINRELKDFITTPEKLGGTRKRLPNLRELTNLFGAYNRQDYLMHSLPRIHKENSLSYRPRAGHVCLLMGTLFSGGAERQLCNLAVGLKRAGWTPTVLVYYAGESEMAPYRKLLTDNGVAYEVIVAPDTGDPSGDILPVFEGLTPDALMALWHMRPDYVLRIACAYKALRKLRPELLVCYLDNNNATGGMGGVLAGVPRVLLSGRSLARPHLVDPIHSYMHNINRDFYRLLSQQSCVFLSNNSPPGAESYAKWLDVPSAKISVIRNCISEEFIQKIKPDLIKKKRRVLGLRKDDPFILGVFRIHPIKRPLDFIRVIAALRKKHPRLRAAICGAFDQDADKAKSLIKKLKLDSVLTLYGITDEVFLMMQLSTLLLHTAEVEGSPNVVLEAQAAGLPVVAAENTGVRLCLADSWKSFMRKPGDIRGLAESCHVLISQSQRHKQLAAKSKVSTRQHYSMAALAANTLNAVGRQGMGTRKKKAKSESKKAAGL